MTGGNSLLHSARIAKPNAVSTNVARNPPCAIPIGLMWIDSIRAATIRCGSSTQIDRHVATNPGLLASGTKPGGRSAVDASGALCCSMDSMMILRFQRQARRFALVSFLTASCCPQATCAAGCSRYNSSIKCSDGWGRVWTACIGWGHPAIGPAADVGRTRCIALNSGVRGPYQRTTARIMSAAFSAIIIVGALVLPPTRVGMTEASTTRRPSMPRTRRLGSTTAISSVPILQVPTGW